MDTQTWTFLFIIITFSTYLYIGWRSRVRESAGFLRGRAGGARDRERGPRRRRTGCLRRRLWGWRA